ncbi:MAG: M48 family metalloprotease [Actinomycetota bacterium]|nr:M48 family metalloprotease [Actinomycetota bacterium]
MNTTAPVTHVELIAKNRRTSLVMLAIEFLLVGILGAAIGILLSRSVPTGILVGATVAIVVDALGWMLAVRATIALTHAVEVTPEQAKVLHDVIEGLCIRTGLPKPRVYIVDDPAPNAFAFGRSPANSGVAVTTGLLNLMSRRELEGVLAHEMSHIRNRDVQVTTLAVTTVGILVAVAEIAARMSWFADWGDDDDNGGAIALIGIAILAGALAFGARLLSLAISRHREELADVSAAELVSPDGIRKALEKLEADHTVVHHVSRATAHLWLVTPLRDGGDDRHAKLNKMFDSHPPLDERIAILRKLEGLDPNGRGPVDETITGVPVDLHAIAQSADRRTSFSPVGAAAATERESASALTSSAPISTTDGAPAMVPVAGKNPPGWYRTDATTLHYWDGTTFTDWTATWNGTRWVQSRGNH